MAIWRDDDGCHWAETGHRYDTESNRINELTVAEQDPQTGRWAAAQGGSRAETLGSPGGAGYVPVSADPLADPLFARLHELAADLLQEVESRGGHPYRRADELRVVLEDVTVLPELLRRSASGSRSAAARSGYQRGRISGARQRGQ